MIANKHLSSYFYYLAQRNSISASKISRRLFSTNIGHRPMCEMHRALRSERALSNIVSVLSGRRGGGEHLSVDGVLRYCLQTVGLLSAF